MTEMSKRQIKKLRKKALSMKCEKCGKRWIAVSSDTGELWCVDCLLERL